MPFQGSVSGMIDGLRAGDETTIRKLWERYCSRLTRLARRKLRPNRRRVVDEEDVAQSAFLSLVRGARQGRFPDLHDRNNLWGLLVFITAQKTADLIANDMRKKRGEGKVRGHSFFAAKDAAGSFDALAGQSPGPATLNVWKEEYERLLERLKDETFKRIAVLRMHGYTVDEIAEKLGCARRTVARKLGLIKKLILPETRP